MAKIIRDPSGFAKKIYDLIIIGGGISGAMLAFEASKRGLKSLLLEKNDFGKATTFNCLGIIHGGFRYLQTLDFHRFRESVGERRWFLKTFPCLVKPLPCLMPLYGDGLRRTSVLRFATWMNDTLTRNRNNGVPFEKYLPNGEILTNEKIKKICPLIDLNGLKGGVVWYDAYMEDPQRIVIDLLQWSCVNLSSALNYVEAQRLISNNRKVNGVSTIDLKKNKIHEYNSHVVINAAGPWSRNISAQFDEDRPELFISSIAWNVLFDKPAISSHALAVKPKKPDARTYFIIPWNGKLLAGTGHAPWYSGPENPIPNSAMLKNFIDDLNFALPAVNFSLNNICHIYSGLLPVKKSGSVNLTRREVILKHASHRGLSGFYSVSGVKFTTSRLVAEKTIKQVFPKSNVLDSQSNIIFS